MAVVERSYVPVIPQSSTQLRPTPQQNNAPEQNWLAPVAETVEQVSDTINAVSDVTSAAAELIWGDDQPEFIVQTVAGLESLSEFAARTSETTTALSNGNFATANLFQSWFSSSSVASSSSSSSTASSSSTSSYAGSSSSAYESGDAIDEEAGTAYVYLPENATANQIRNAQFNVRAFQAKNEAAQIIALIPDELKAGSISFEQLRDLNIDIPSLMAQISIMTANINFVLSGANADLVSQLNPDIISSISGAQAFTAALGQLRVNQNTALQSVDSNLAVQGGQNRTEASRAGGGGNNNDIAMRNSFLAQRGIIFSDGTNSDEQVDNSTDTGPTIYAPSPVGTISVYTPRNATASSFTNSLALTG